MAEKGVAEMETNKILKHYAMDVSTFKRAVGMETSKRLKALLIAVVVVGWGAIVANIYLNFFEKSVQPNTTSLDLVSGQTQHVSR